MKNENNKMVDWAENEIKQLYEKLLKESKLD